MNLTELELQNLIEQAAKKGAEEALKKVGLSDEKAYHDMRELRMLLDSWRGTKKTVGKTVLQFSTTALLSVIAAIVWMQEKNIGG